MAEDGEASVGIEGMLGHLTQSVGDMTEVVLLMNVVLVEILKVVEDRGDSSKVAGMLERIVRKIEVMQKGADGKG